MEKGNRFKRLSLENFIIDQPRRSLVIFQKTLPNRLLMAFGREFDQQIIRKSLIAMLTYNLADAMALDPSETMGSVNIVHARKSADLWLDRIV